MMSEKTFEKLTALLDQNQARYRVVEHSSAGKSEDVAKIRGTQIGQGAKALVCTLKGNGVKQTILAVLPAGGSTGGFRQNCCEFWRKESFFIQPRGGVCTY